MNNKIKISTLTEFGVALRKLRLDYGERMGDMAERLHISTAYLSAIENGRQSIPHTIISDARRYLSEYGVENMSGLVNCITDELENSGFTAKRVYIASSSLRIESLLEITDDSGKAQPSKADEASNTSIVSKQVYGSIVYDNKVCTSTVVSIGDSYVLRSLAESFDAKGYRGAGHRYRCYRDSDGHSVRWRHRH